MIEQHKVLMVSYTFPPLVGSGVHRLVQFAHYLPEYKWEPFILTGDHENVAQDWTPLQGKNLPQDNVVRAKDLFPIIFRSSVIENSPSAAKPATLKMKDRTNLKQEIKRWAFIPDEQMLWIFNALRKGLKFVRRHKIDILFSSSLPASSHVVAWQIKKRTGIPWVADYRDLWTYNSFRNDVGTLRWRVDRALENACLKHADAVVTVSPKWPPTFSQFQIDGIMDRVHLILNAYDPRDFEDIQKQTESKFTILHTGILYGQHRNPEILLQAIRNLIDSGTVDESRICIRMVGYYNQHVYQLAEEYSLEQVVEQTGRVSHQQAIQMQVNATVLLLLGRVDAIQAGGIPAKVFEYLGAQRPILALVPESTPVANIVAETNSGFIINPDAKIQLQKIIHQLYREFEVTGTVAYRGHSGKIAGYSRRERTRQLVALFDSLIGD